VTVGELCRTPAVDRTADELLRADDEPETDKDDNRVLSTQTVDVVIVHAKLQVANAQHRLEQAIHRVGLMYDRSRDNDLRQVVQDDSSASLAVVSKHPASCR